MVSGNICSGLRLDVVRENSYAMQPGLECLYVEAGCERFPLTSRSHNTFLFLKYTNKIGGIKMWKLITVESSDPDSKKIWEGVKGKLLKLKDVKIGECLMVLDYNDDPLVTSSSIKVAISVNNQLFVETRHTKLVFTKN